LDTPRVSNRQQTACCCTEKKKKQTENYRREKKDLQIQNLSSHQDFFDPDLLESSHPEKHKVMELLY